MNWMMMIYADIANREYLTSLQPVCRDYFIMMVGITNIGKKMNNIDYEFSFLNINRRGYDKLFLEKYKKTIIRYLKQIYKKSELIEKYNLDFEFLRDFLENYFIPNREVRKAIRKSDCAPFLHIRKNIKDDQELVLYFNFPQKDTEEQKTIIQVFNFNTYEEKSKKRKERYEEILKRRKIKEEKRIDYLVNHIGGAND